MRTKAALVALLAAAVVSAPGRAAADAGPRGRPRAGPSSAILQILHTPPVLVRAGETIRIPVDVVCVTAEGDACAPRLSFRVGRARHAVRHANTQASRVVSFVLSAPRDLGPAGSEVVDYSIEARPSPVAGVLPGKANGSSGQVASVSSRFYVARRLPVLELPAIPFGEVRRGRTVLFLPWGTGPSRAGVSIGKEAQTLGPSSFDVDASGRVHLLDPLQRRLALFSRGELVRVLPLSSGAGALVAVGEDGRAYVVDSSGRSATVTMISPSGAVEGRAEMGPGFADRIHAAPGGAAVSMLPQDGWVPVRVHQGAPAVSPRASIGRPIGPGLQLIRGGNERFVRLGTVEGDRLLAPVELRSAHDFGEVALAEPDGDRGYWVVVRVWREHPKPADQFQVIHVSSRLDVTTFAVADRSFADIHPSAAFRIGRDGGLYHLSTTAAGMWIDHYQIGGDR